MLDVVLLPLLLFLLFVFLTVKRVAAQNSFFLWAEKAITTLFLLACMTLTGLPFASSSAHAFSVGEERKYGDEMLTRIRKDFTLLEEPDVVQYINSIGNEILTVTSSQYFTYHFYVIDNKEFNAFAAPAGLIFFHSGLIEKMEHENELVSVMAHEVGHVSSRHISESIKKSSRSNLITIPLLLGGIAMGGGELTQALITGAIATGASLSLKYSRQHEEEADRLACQWMQDLGRDPQDMIGMLQKMRKVSVYQAGQVPPYLLSHPKPIMRIGYTEDLLLFNDPAKKYRDIDEFDFLRFQCRVLAKTWEPERLIKKYRHKISVGKEDDPETIMAYYGLAIAYLNKKKLSDAKKFLQKVVAHYPNKSILQADLAVILLEENHHPEALELFSQARQQNPHCAYTNYWLAMALQEKQPAQAAQLFERLLYEIPDYPPAYYQLGILKTAEKEKGLGHYYLGLYYHLEGELGVAQYHFKQALQRLDSDSCFRIRAQAMIEKITSVKK